MILLFGALTSILLEAYKWLTFKFGRTMATNEILFGSFALSVLWVILTKQNIITQAALDQVGLIFASSVGVFEIVIRYLRTFLPLAGDTTPNAPTDTTGVQK